MQLPIWMPGLGHVNMYGLVDDRGLTVVDPGLPGPQSWKALKQRLEDRGLPAQGHPHRRRHALAPRPLRRRGPHRARGGRQARHAPRVLDVDGEGPDARSARSSEGEARRARGRSRGVRAVGRRRTRRAPDDQRSRRRARRHRRDRGDVEPVGRDDAVGHDEPGSAAEAPADDPARCGMLFTPPEPTDRVHHGERLQLAGREWFVVHTPGHTVDHLCLWDPETGTLLTGDHVLPSITPHVSGVRKADSLKSYLATLDLVGAARRREARPARARPSVRRRAGPRRGDQGASRRAHGAVARRRARARPRDGRRSCRTRCSRSGTGARWRRARRSPTSSTSCTPARPSGGRRTACSCTAWNR